MIIRGHEYTPQGYKWNHGGKVLTVFSSRAGPYSDTSPHIVVIDNDSLSIIDVS